MEPLIITVRWTPGEPELTAAVTVLSNPNDAALLHITAALRAGQAVIETRLEQIAAEAQGEVERLRAELATSNLTVTVDDENEE